MPPKRKTAASAPSRPFRATKTRAAETIHQAIARRGRRTTGTTVPAPPEAVANPPRVVANPPDLAALEERFQDLEASISENQTVFRSALSDIFNQIVERLDTMESRHPTAPEPLPPAMDSALQGAQGTNPLGDPHPLGNPRDVLSRFYWVDKAVIQTIADGDFDIHDLPKLHREEDQRMRHNRKVTEGVHFPVDGGKPELVIGRTKMHSAFKDLATFLSAWMVYVSIRSSFVPERASALAYWTERVVFYAQSGFQWSVVLNYAIAYFTAHQKSPSDTWYSVNTDRELATNHFTVARKTSVPETSNPTQSRPSGKKSPSVPIQEQTCAIWNRPLVGCNYKERFGFPCPRKHRCSTCLNSAHKATECPLKPAA